MRRFQMLIIVFLLMIFPIHAYAQSGDYQNPVTGYKAMIYDAAVLLTDEEKASLITDMEPITDYGTVLLVTILENETSSADEYARQCYNTWIGSGNGTVFLIDMDNRELIIYTNGHMQYMITGAVADSITDNVYRYATKEQYYDCCKEVFAEEYTVLQGEKIQQPMRYVSNAFFAIVIAFLLNYFLVKLLSTVNKPSNKKLLMGVKHHQAYTHVSTKMTHTTKTYSPRESSGSGGSGGSGGGSSGGHGF